MNYRCFKCGKMVGTYGYFRHFAVVVHMGLEDKGTEYLLCEDCTAQVINHLNDSLREQANA